MAIKNTEIAEWRALRGQGLTSAIGEYTPSEFWRVLDEFESLRNRCAMEIGAMHTVILGLEDTIRRQNERRRRNESN